MKLKIQIIDVNNTIMDSTIEVIDLKSAINALRTIIKACEAILKNENKKQINLAKVAVDELDI